MRPIFAVSLVAAFFAGASMVRFVPGDWDATLPSEQVPGKYLPTLMPDSPTSIGELNGCYYAREQHIGKARNNERYTVCYRRGIYVGQPIMGTREFFVDQPR